MAIKFSDAPQRYTIIMKDGTKCTTKIFKDSAAKLAKAMESPDTIFTLKDRYGNVEFCGITGEIACFYVEKED